MYSSDCYGSVLAYKWIVYRQSRRGKVEELDDRPLAKLLQRPNPGKGRRFFENLAAFLMLSGNSYVEADGHEREKARNCICCDQTE